MKCVISTTYDDKYLFFLPITTWLWNRLGVDVVCFMPYLETEGDNKRIDLINDTFRPIGIRPQYVGFNAPKHKQATYAQCSRLYAAALDLPEDEILVTSDIDMALFNMPVCYPMDGYFTIFGADLVPQYQYPICYISAPVKDWRSAFDISNSYQNKLDDLLGEINCDNMRGNYWAKDQEEAYIKISLFGGVFMETRANNGTQFATRRIDRDDAYFMDRLNPDVIDYHMHRPGYTDENFEKILAVISYFYPYEDLNWMREYQKQYKELL